MDFEESCKSFIMKNMNKIWILSNQQLVSRYFRMYFITPVDFHNEYSYIFLCFSIFEFILMEDRIAE